MKGTEGEDAMKKTEEITRNSSFPALFALLELAASLFSHLPVSLIKSYGPKR